MALEDEQLRQAVRARQTVADPVFSGTRRDKTEALLADLARGRADRDSLLTPDGDPRYVHGLTPFDNSVKLI